MFGWFKRDKMKKEIIINCEHLETRVTLVENGRIEEFEVEHPTEERIVGSIFKGRIQNLENDLQAAFVDIGLRKNAFIHYWDMVPDDDTRMEQEEGGSRGGNRRRRLSNEEISKRFSPGSEIVVQVTKGAIGTKGPRVTTNLSLPGRYLVMMPGSHLRGVSRKIEDDRERQRLKKILQNLTAPVDVGLVVRTAGFGQRKGLFHEDLEDLLETWNELKRLGAERPAPTCLYDEPDLVDRVLRDWVTDDIDRITIDSKDRYEKIRERSSAVARRVRSRVHLFEGELSVFEHYDIERQLADAFRRKVALKSGGYIVLDETEAMIAIDVNTGRHKGSGSQEDAIVAVNLEAVDEVARQLRLRNIGGLVVVDFIDMKSRKNQHNVFKAMRAAFKRDKARTNVLPISELGLMQLTRQRVDESIQSTMYTDCPYCRGRGMVKSPLAVSVEIQRQTTSLLRRLQKGEGVELQIVVHPVVMDRLRREDEQFLVDLERKFAGRLKFKSDPGKHVEYFAIHNGVTGEVLYSSADR